MEEILNEIAIIASKFTFFIMNYFLIDC